MATEKIQDGRHPEDENTLARAQDFSAAVDNTNLIFEHNLPFLLLKKTSEPDF